MSEDVTEEITEEITDGEMAPLKVEVITKEKPKESPTSEDTKDTYEYDMPTEQEIKEMTDAQ